MPAPDQNTVSQGANVRGTRPNLGGLGMWGVMIGHVMREVQDAWDTDMEMCAEARKPVKIVDTEAIDVPVEENN